jgi:hypothetical protein
MLMIGYSPKVFSVSLQDYLRTMLFGVYLLIRKRAVLRYIYRLLAACVSLLANMDVLYHIYD